MLRINWMGRTVCAAVVCMSCFSAASAGIVETQTHAYDVNSPYVPMFDGSLGALDKVTLEIDLTPFGALLTLFHNGSSSWPFLIEASEKVKVDILGKFGIDAPKFGSQISAGLQVIAGEAITVTLDSQSGAGISSDNFDSSKDLSVDLNGFVGIGNLEVVFSYDRSSSGTSPAPGSPDLTTDLLHFNYETLPGGQLTYTYTTPEPMTLGLLSIGGMALLRRRSA